MHYVPHLEDEADCVRVVFADAIRMAHVWDNKVAELVLDIKPRPVADVDRDIFDPLIEADQSAWDDSEVDDLAFHVRSPAGR